MKNFTRFFTITKIILLFNIFVSFSAYAQPTVLGTSINANTYTRYDLVTRGGGVRFVRVQAASPVSAGRVWEFATGTAASPNYTTNWRPYTSGQTISAFNTYIDPTSILASARYNTSSGGQSGLLPSITNNNYYTFIVGGSSTANNFMSVLSTSYNPKNITAASQSPVAVSVGVGAPVIVTTTISATLSTNETVFLRYSNDSFATSTIIPFSTSGTTLTATIPGDINTPSATISYYIFSSNQSTAPSVAQADYFTLNLYNASGQNASGGGTNYTYNVIGSIPTYTWNQTGTASWATATNWTPTRTTPGVYDNLVFNNGATTTATGIPAQTVGSITVSGNTTVNLQNAGATALTIGNGLAGADLSVAVGSALNANGANALTLTMASTATAIISGNMTFSNAVNQFLGTDASSITFNNGSSFSQGTSNTGSVFGTSGTANTVIFLSGSAFNQNAGSNPFGLTQPTSKVTFQTGSNYIHNVAGGSGLGFSGRTYANLTLAGGGTATLTGGSAVYIDNLTVTNSTTLNIGMTGTGANISSINGNISVASGSTFNANGTGASIQFNGASQTISGAGAYIIATAQTINIPTTRQTSLQSNITITGTGQLAVSGTINMGTVIVSGTGVFNLISGATLITANTAGIASTLSSGSVQTTTRTLNSGANYVYNGVANQITGTGLPATVNTLTINNSGTSPNNIVTLTAITGITSTTNTLRLQAGRFDLNAKQLTIPTGGTVASTGGDFTATAGPVFFIGTGTVSGTVNFPTVTIAGGVNFGSSSTIVTSLQLNSGAFINTNAPTYGSSSTLIYNTTGTYGRNLEWSATSGAGYPNHVQVQNGTTVDLAANGFADRAIAGNLNLGLVGAASAGSLSMGATTNKLTVGGNVVIGGNTSGTSVLTLSSAIGGDVYLSGNWDTNINGSYASNTRAVFFEGTGTSTVTTIGAATFDYLFINKTSGGTVSLANDMTVNNNLTLNAQLVTNAFKIIIPTGNNVTANANGWVRGNLQKNIPTGTNSRIFEIGDISNYTPVTTDYISVSTSGNIIVSTTTNDHPQIASSVVDPSNSVNRFYTITNSGVAGGTYNPTFTFGGDFDSGAQTGNFDISNYVNPTWTTLTTGTRTATSTQATGVTQYGAFQIGEGKRTVWTAGANTTAWTTPANWSNGVPTSTTIAYINSASFYPEVTSDVVALSLIINSGTSVTVMPNFDLTVTDVIANAGTLTIENNANLLQTNNVANTGSGVTVVKRNSSLLKRLDYTLWSSPVTGQGLYAFSKFTLPNRFYVYDTASDLYSNSAISIPFSLAGLQYPSPLDPLSGNGVDGTDTANVLFANGKGYLIRVPYNHPTTGTVYNGIFTGVATNGTVSPTVSTALNGFNAVGNPYPSRLNVHNFIDGNANITGPLYFWRKTNTAAVSTSYATLTKTAYVANGSAGGDTGTGFFPTGGGQEANWVINVGQGFIVKATSGTTINFTNSMRRSLNADQFFRNSQTTNTANNGLYWLNLTDNTGVYSQTAVGYNSEGTVGFDRGIDGENINNEFYLTSLIGTDEYAIQGRPDFDASDVVPMSYKAITAGNYTISIDHTDGGFTEATQPIYLKDLVLNTEHDLKTGAYNFTSVAGTFNNRFQIVYQSALGIDNPILTANNVIIYNQNNEFIVINAGNIIMSSIKVFDIRGRLLEEKKGINASQTTIGSGLTNEVLLVQITSEDGVVVTKKVVR